MILKHFPKKDYTVISNDVLRDERLSFKATGVLCYILSLPEDWNVRITHLATVKKESISAVRTAMDELKKYGYIRERRVYCPESGKTLHFCDATQIPFEFEEATVRKSNSR